MSYLWMALLLVVVPLLIFLLKRLKEAEENSGFEAKEIDSWNSPASSSDEAQREEEEAPEKEGDVSEKEGAGDLLITAGKLRIASIIVLVGTAAIWKLLFDASLASIMEGSLDQGEEQVEDARIVMVVGGLVALILALAASVREIKAGHKLKG